MAPILTQQNIHATAQVRDTFTSRFLEDAEERVAVLHIICDSGLGTALVRTIAEALRSRVLNPPGAPGCAFPSLLVIFVV